MNTEQRLEGLSLPELRQLVRVAEDQVYSRRCTSYHQNTGTCVLEKGHEGFHRNDFPDGSGGTARRPDEAMTYPVITMWEFFDSRTEQP